MPSDDWEVGEARCPVANEQRRESKTELAWCKAPGRVLEHVSVRLEEAEDQSIAESREKREERDDGLADQHFVRAAHDGEDLALVDLLMLRRADDIGIWIFGPFFLGFTIE